MDNEINVYYLLRIARNMSSKELAEKLMITPAYVRAIETGKRTPSKRLLRDYARVLNVDESVIQTFEKPQEQKNFFEHSLLKLLKIICNIDE